MLAVIETHPVQYHAPVYRALQQTFGVPVTAIYGSDFSARAYRDREFGAEVAWDADLLTGYSHRVLAPAAAHQREPGLAALSAHGLEQVLRAVRPAATLIVGYSPSFHRQAWHAAWRLGRPVLFRGETTDAGQSRSRVVSFARDVGLRVAYRTCARLLYIGERSRRHYRRLGVPEQRLVFAPYCVDTTPFRPDEPARTDARDVIRAALAIDPGDLVFVFSGKLSERKGVDLLPAAIRRLPEPLRRRALVLFVGDGAMRSELELATRVAPAVRARFVGFQRQHDLSDYYHASDVLVLPSRRAETWGLVVNEALHHGLPSVVSNRVGCAADLITPDTGCVCEADAVESLAQALGEAASLAGRVDIRARCRERAAGYSVDSAAAGIASAYRAVTGEAA